MVRPIHPPSQASSAAPAPSRVEQAIDVLLAEVLDGTYAPGSALPPERELAPRLGVSRTSLRQAITRLAQLGVVSAQQGRGTVVLDVADSTDPTLVSRMAREHGTDLVAELFEVREAMGALAGRLAARRCTPADLRALGDALDEVRHADDAAQRQGSELAFFVHLVDAAHNRPLRTMLRWVEQAYGTSGDTFTAAFDDRDAVLTDLEAILDAVRAGDERAAADAVTEYASRSARRMLDALGNPG